MALLLVEVLPPLTSLIESIELDEGTFTDDDRSEEEQEETSVSAVFSSSLGGLEESIFSSTKRMLLILRRCSSIVFGATWFVCMFGEQEDGVSLEIIGSF